MASWMVRADFRTLDFSEGTGVRKLQLEGNPAIGLSTQGVLARVIQSSNSVLAIRGCGSGSVDPVPFAPSPLTRPAIPPHDHTHRHP
jgi:hypothetical protein